MKSKRIRVIVLAALLLALAPVGRRAVEAVSNIADNTPEGTPVCQYNSASYAQCPGAPFAVPAEYVHASYSTLPNWTHVGIDMTGLTADFNLARNPPVCSVGSGIWEVGVPGIAPVYAAYDGVVWGSHIVNGTWIGLYIKHENVPVNGHIEPVICTYYEHMGNYNTGQSTIFPQFRSLGAPVQKGEQIGWIGNQSGTGSTFAHLHFGVRPSLYNGGCNPGSNPPPLDPYWWTDPSPYLGFNVNWGSGARQSCYQVGCSSDVTPPDTSMVSGPSGVIGGNSATLIWTGSDNQTPTPNLQYNYRLDGYSDWSAWTSSTSVTYNGLSDRSYTFRVKARDQAGNEDPSPAERSFTVDASPPTAPIISIGGAGCAGIQNNAWQNTCYDPAFTWSATDVGGSGINGYFYCWSTSSNCSPTTWTTGASFDPAAIAPANSVATYYLNVKARDALNHDSSSATFGVLYDGAAPTVTLSINGGAATTHQTTVHLNLSAADAGSGVADVRLSNNALAWSDWQPFTDLLSWSIPALDRRTHTVYAQVRDQAGNESALASDSIYLDLYPPMPHSASYRLCADVVDMGGSVGSAWPCWA